MSAYENAIKFFHACESAAGWEGCREYVVDDAPFDAQSEPLVEITTVAAYCDWLAGFGTVTAPNATYHLHHQSFDEDSKTAAFFGTYQATHTGEGGPVPPTGKETKSHYVYIITMSEDDKVASMTKIWNVGWAMAQLGWA